uniref:Homing endonuclease LAGLIDADG domain-containing protein n=1 Tax=Orbilia brochopaga TaxID=3140254 RepID=A0A4Y5MZY4_9PEZI|nr:hypothetical protein [Drechslerella brochopaga]
MYGRTLRYFATWNVNHKSFDPWFVTGLVDAEGSFTVSVLKSSSTNIGWTVNARFKLTVHITDTDLLLNLKKYFEDVGNIVIFKNTCTYRVDKLKDIMEVIVPHFDKYPLTTQKLADYILFKEIISLMKNKEHLTLDGLKKILSFKCSLNLGLSEELKNKFPGIEPVKRPLVIDNNIPSPFWMAGFTTGDGSFYLTIRSKKLNNIPRIDIEFSITQHSRDMLLLEKFITFFNCGRIKKDSRHSVHYYKVTNIKDIINNIIPFFNKYNIKGVKSLNFVDWCKAAVIIKSKAHLTSEGVDNIYAIQSKINNNRFKI